MNCSTCEQRAICDPRSGDLLPCEADVTRSRKYGQRIRWRQYLRPGQEFTAHDLADSAHTSLEKAHLWCHDRVRANELIVVGQARGPGRVYIYRFQGGQGG